MSIYSRPAVAPLYPATIFFDGGCPLCVREIGHYRHLPHGNRLVFLDIRGADFQAEEFGRGQEQFMARMHARDAAGHWYLGVDAFPVIWGALPGWRFRWLERLLCNRLFYPLAKGAYRLFAANRHRLQGRGCGDSCRPR